MGACILLAAGSLMASSACGAVGSQADGLVSPSQSAAILQGTVVTEPTCPVQRIGSPCPPAPLPGARVEAYEGGTLTAAVITDLAGHYEMRLALGHYMVRVANPSLPRLVTEQTIDLSGNTYLNLSVDSGIR
jgi:hypothetical protein